MSETELIGLLSVIRVAYPRFYSNITLEDTKSTVALWLEMLKDDNSQDVTRAVKELICELEFPPTIADVKTRIRKYEEDRHFHEYAQKLELEEQKERLMIEAEHRNYKEPTSKPKVDASKYIKNIKQILFRSGSSDV